MSLSCRGSSAIFSHLTNVIHTIAQTENHACIYVCVWMCVCMCKSKFNIFLNSIAKKPSTCKRVPPESQLGLNVKKFWIWTQVLWCQSVSPNTDMEKGLKIFQQYFCYFFPVRIKITQDIPNVNNYNDRNAYSINSLKKVGEKEWNKFSFIWILETLRECSRSRKKIILHWCSANFITEIIKGDIKFVLNICTFHLPFYAMLISIFAS